MRGFKVAGVGIAVLCLISFAVSPAQAQNGQPWLTWDKPAPGGAEAIGYYANGCIRGAVALPLDGPGWRVLRPQRNRFWGHPDLIVTIRELTRRVRAETGQALLIADLAQPRGGPSTGHASHQSGLDADIRFQLVPDGPLDPALRREGTMLSMVASGGKALDRSLWGPGQMAMVRIAAQLPRMDRIFVHPTVKREACRIAGNDRAWLAKVVPWYGHDDHMHIRIKCPAGSQSCVPQAPLPEGDGCGAALAWWFTDEPYRAKVTKPARRPGPPAACQTLWRR